MLLIPHEGKSPRLGAGCYVAPTATLIGDVTVEDGASIWFGCVLRGDVSPITIGRNSNIQDLTVIHGETGAPTTIGEYVTVGHGAIIHAAHIGDRVLVGMGAVLLSRSTVGADTVIGARALVVEGMEVPGEVLALGAPARVKRTLTEEEKQGIIASAARYLKYAAEYLGAVTD